MIAHIKTHVALLVALVRAAPAFVLDRLEAFNRREDAKQLLRAETGKTDARWYLHAVDGDPHAALAVARARIDPASAIAFRERGFSAATLVHVARLIGDPGATSPATEPPGEQ